MYRRPIDSYCRTRMPCLVFSIVPFVRHSWFGDVASRRGIRSVDVADPLGESIKKMRWPVNGLLMGLDSGLRFAPVFPFPMWLLTRFRYFDSLFIGRMSGNLQRLLLRYISPGFQRSMGLFVNERGRRTTIDRAVIKLFISVISSWNRTVF